MVVMQPTWKQTLRWSTWPRFDGKLVKLRTKCGSGPSSNSIKLAKIIKEIAGGVPNNVSTLYPNFTFNS